MKRTLFSLVVVATGLTAVAWAQDEEPGRGVARISVMNGDVSVRRGDSGDSVAAALNAPLTVGDRLLTGAGARAEVQLDWANMVRLASLTELRFATLDPQRAQVQLASGMVTFSVLRDSQAQIEISTPSVSVRALGKGSYRIVVREDGSSEITVRSGEAEIFTPRGSERLPAGRTMLTRGTAADPEFQVVAAVQLDDWDRWNAQRDQSLGRSQAYNYVSPDISGAEDLDNYGTWENVAPYGNCWYPRVAEDWAPYRYGRWGWMDWYGWNWLSYDPWGWAPYHYGRWFYAANRGWGWWPGGFHHRHYWSPGLVAFVGWNRWGGAGVGFGFGGLGWIPLAPYEPYYPWYGRRYYMGYRDGRLGNGMHVVNDVNVRGVYRNARVQNGVTTVDHNGFVSGRAGSAWNSSRGDLTHASLVRGPLPVAPGRESLRLSDRQVRMNNLPQTRNDTRFVSRQQPARVDRVPFADQRRGIEQMARNTFGSQRVGTGVSGGSLARPGSTGRATAGTESWRQAGGAAAGNRTATVTNSWRRFGEPGRGAQYGAATDSWRRLGTGAGTTGSRAMGPNYRGNSGNYAPRYAMPRYGSPGAASPQVYRGGGQAPVRISPPIVRERAPSFGGGSYSRPSSNFGGSYSRPAPSGGGGSRMGGGGGGGSHGGRSR